MSACGNALLLRRRADALRLAAARVQLDSDHAHSCARLKVARQLSVAAGRMIADADRLELQAMEITL